MIGIGLGLGMTRGGGGASLPNGAIALWSMDEVVTDGGVRVVPNAISNEPVSQNLVQAPRRRFSDTAFYQKSGVTVTDNTTGATGSTVVAAGNFFVAGYTSTWPAGIYTMVVDCERQGGADAQFKMGWGTTTYLSAAKTATATRQRITHTVTLPAGSYVPYFLNSIDGATGASVRVFEAAIYQGVVDLGLQTLDGHLCLGGRPFDSRVTLGSNFVDISSTGFGMVQWDTNVALSEFTCVWLTKTVAAPGAFDTIFCIPYSATNFVVGTKYNNRFRNYFGGRGLDRAPDRLEVAVQNFALNEGWQTGAASCSSSGASAQYIGPTKIVSGLTATAPTTLSLSDLYFGVVNTTAIPSGIQFAGAILYDRVLTDAEVTSAQNWLLARFSGITTGLPQWFIAHEGDSISQAPNYPTQVAPILATKAVMANFAQGGSGLAGGTTTAVGRQSALEAIPERKSGTQRVVLTLAHGRNGSWLLADFLDDLETYLTELKAAGMEIGVCTILPSTEVGFNTKRNAANAQIYAWEGTLIDFIIDFAGDPTMGPDAAASNVTLYSDGTHPTALGQDNLEAIYLSAVDAYMALP